MIPISYRKITHVCIGTGTFFAAELLARHFFPGAFPEQKFVVAIVIALLGGFVVALLTSKWLLGETVVAIFFFSLALSADDLGAAVMTLALLPIAAKALSFVCISWIVIVFGLAGSSLGTAARLAVVGPEKKRNK